MLSSSSLFYFSFLLHCHVDIADVTFLSSMPTRHDHVILLYLYTSLLPNDRDQKGWLQYKSKNR